MGWGRRFRVRFVQNLILHSDVRIVLLDVRTGAALGGVTHTTNHD